MGSHWRPHCRDSSLFCDCILDPRAAPLLRSYSLSSAPGGGSLSHQHQAEEHGAASSYLRDRIRVGDCLEVSAPRGAFTLRSDERPAVLLSAGVGVTPVLAMLHALAATTINARGLVVIRRAQRRGASFRSRVR